jgi:hypothetical protein
MNGSLHKKKGQSVHIISPNKTIKQESYIKGKSTNAHTNILAFERDISKNVVNTFRPGLFNGMNAGTKFKTTKNSRKIFNLTLIAERANDLVSNFKNVDKYNHYEPFDIRNYSNEKKGYQLMKQNYFDNSNVNTSQHNNNKKTNTITQSTDHKLKEIEEENGGIDNLMLRKLAKKKDMKSNLLNYTNPFGNKYSHLMQKMQLETSKENNLGTSSKLLYIITFRPF